MLLPKSRFVFSVNGPVVFRQLYGFGEDEIYRRLGYWLEEFWEANEERIEEMERLYFAAGVALVVQLVSWTMALSDTTSRNGEEATASASAACTAGLGPC